MYKLLCYNKTKYVHKGFDAFLSDKLNNMTFQKNKKIKPQNSTLSANEIFKKYQSMQN